MPNRFEPAADLEQKVLTHVLIPQVVATQDALVTEVQTTGPIDSGLLRRLVAKEPVQRFGLRVVGRVVSSRPTDDGRAEVPAWLEFGTRRIAPMRYMARAARRVVARRRIGRFDGAMPPW